MEGKRGNDLQALTEIADNDVLIVDTGEGTRKITYGALCAAVKNTLGIREVVESTNITEPGFLMDGKTASEAFAELYSKKLNYKIYNNRTGGISSINNHTRTQEIILESCDFNMTSYLLYINNPQGANEIILIYDMGRPYLTALKLSYYSASGEAQITLYRHTSAGWSVPQIANMTNVAI